MLGLVLALMVGPLKWVPTVVADGLIYEDCAQTSYFVARGYPEQNPLLGSHPSKLRLGISCLAAAGVNTVPFRYHSLVNVLTIVIESYVVLANRTVTYNGSTLYVGIRATF